jgi:hypothetical protein
VMAPAQAYSGQAQTVIAQQLGAQQTATQAAINKIASMDDQTAQSIFGMTKEQASNILTYGRDDLKEKLSGLINNIDTQTSQTLNVQEAQAKEAYNNALTRLAQKNSMTNDLTNTVIGPGMSDLMMSQMGGSTAGGSGTTASSTGGGTAGASGSGGGGGASILPMLLKALMAA